MLRAVGARPRRRSTLLDDDRLSDSLHRLRIQYAPRLEHASAQTNSLRHESLDSENLFQAQNDSPYLIEKLRNKKMLPCSYQVSTTIQVRSHFLSHQVSLSDDNSNTLLTFLFAKVLCLYQCNAKPFVYTGKPFRLNGRTGRQVISRNKRGRHRVHVFFFFFGNGQRLTYKSVVS